MTFLISKYLITAFIIVFVSEIAKRSDKMGALISSLPLVTILVMIWLYLENQSTEKIANHAYYTFWYVIPTLPMFLVIPFLLSRGYSFSLSLSISIIITFFCFIFTAYIAKLFGVNLIP
ncbi:MAG: DUF3147 family protein [Candidatus Marinimicrobia bacterium]|nr:DUF3147 family protein [Candidatus Neomarinimicrobiota bacterium]